MSRDFLRPISEVNVNKQVYYFFSAIFEKLLLPFTSNII